MLNITATLMGDLPADPLSWKVITSGLNPRDATMFTLFGNEKAMERARTYGPPNYVAGAVLSLVTWRQQEDARWFGAYIPAQPTSVEFVTAQLASNGRTTYTYQEFAGVPLRERPTPAERADERIAWFLSRRAAVMP